MSFKNTLFITLFTALLSSCGLLYEYRSLHEFKGFEWNNSDPQSFEFEIEKEGYYNIELIGRHLTGFPFKDLNCSISMTNQEEQMETMVTIPIIADDGMYLSEGGGDFWDFEFPALNNVLLKPAKYTIIVNHQMNKNPLPLFMEIGIQVVKAEK